MNYEQLLLECVSLSIEDRIRLAGDIWDSIPEEPGAIQLTDEQVEILEQRLAAHEADPSRVIPWEEVRERISRRFGPEREDASGG